MVRNVKAKKLLKGTVFRVLTWINRCIPKNDKIVLLYSANLGIRHALIPLRKYLLDEGYDNKYRIYCGIESMKFAEQDGLKYINHIKSVLVFLRAKHVFYTVGQIPIRPSKTQSVIHMKHGNANFKSSGLNTAINNGDEFFFTHMCASSQLFVPIMAEEYGCSAENIAVVGDPMIDALLSPRDRYDFSGYGKMVLWLPTFRQSDGLGYDDSSMKEAVPLFEEKEYARLNEVLKGYDIMMIVKLHSAQNDSIKGKRHFSNLKIYTNKEFEGMGYELYSMMASSDALIGDYSSASMQYLILDRPQAYVVPDLTEYAEKRGFAFDNPKDYMAGHIIVTKQEFYKFLDDLANDLDVYAEKRHRVRDEVYRYKDCNNCKRVVELSGMKL